jgi:hypothetical protein
LTLYVLYELVLIVLKLGFVKSVTVAIFLYDGLIILGVLKRKKINVNSAR